MSTLQSFPREPRSRRVGWTQGEPVRLADCESWYFPKVGDHLIPSLPRLVPLADPLNREVFAVVYMGMDQPPGFGARTLEFARAVLETQYDVPPETIRGLVEGFDEEAGTAMVGVIDRFLEALLNYATSRAPFAATPGLASLAASN